MASRAFREVVRAACWPPLPLRNVGRPFHRPAPKISTQLTLRRVTPTIPHLGAAKAIGLLYLYIVGLMVIVRISYGYGNPWVGLINNTITELTLTPVACGAIRYANWGLSGRDAHKNFVGVHLPFPFFPSPSSLLFFYLYFRIFSRTRLRNLRECLSSLAGPGGAAKRHLVNFGLKDCFW